MKILDRLLGRSKAIDQFWDTERGWTYISGAPKKGYEPSRFTARGGEAAYEHNSVVQACAKMIASTAPEPSIEVGIWVDNENWKPAPQHRAIQLLENHPKYSKSEIIRYMALRYVLTGEGYAWKLRNTGNRPVELWPIPTSMVTPKMTRQGRGLIEGYTVAGNDNLVSPDDMVRLYDGNAASTWCASSGMQAAWKDYLLDEERKQYMGEMILNADVPGMIIKPERGWTDEQADAFRQKLNEKAGRGDRGNTIILPGATSADLHTPLADFDWPSITSLLETRICMGFGVPPILIGTRAGLDRSTYSNYEEARKSFYEETMVPLWTSMADTFTKHLLRVEGEPNLVFRFVWDDLPIFQEDADATALRAMRLYTAGLIGLSEARGMVGYDEQIPDDIRNWGSANGNGRAEPQAAPTTTAN